MIIRAIELRIDTISGIYGFSFTFARNLTVIRGNNSSGKSTLFNCLLFSIGMEELVGGKGEHVLPYAVREYFDYEGQRLNVLSSETIVEIENRAGSVVTLRRPVRSAEKDSKLIEIFVGAHLGTDMKGSSAIPTYIHDPGSAQRQEGFFTYLEKFLDLRLPRVATTSGTDVKLYLQAIFAAHAVEQKRGWTDYIANIPFYGIRDVRTRVGEYVLGLGVFETIVARNRLNSEASILEQQWRDAVEALRREARINGVLLDGIDTQPSLNFDLQHLTLLKPTDSGDAALSEYVKDLLNEHALLQASTDSDKDEGNTELVEQIEALEERIRTLSIRHDRANANLALQRSSAYEYEQLLKEARLDLDRNKATQKLQELGAHQAVELALGVCPTCGQPVEDSLLRETTGPQMDLQTNIAYLESQSKMLERQIGGVHQEISRSVATIESLASRLKTTLDQAAALRSDLGVTNSQAKAVIRRQVQIEVEIESLQELETFAAQQMKELQSLSDKLVKNQLARRALPSRQYSDDDSRKIDLFEKMFRANAGSFGYESVSNIAEIFIARENLVPALAQIELREILKKQTRTDVKADSSASDFVRLIWSYLLGLYQTSSHRQTPGNHLGIILLDEPGQHSMRWESQRELLLRLASEASLQSIVAASFDESETVFRDVTNNVAHQLISWEGKVIRPR